MKEIQEVLNDLGIESKTAGEHHHATDNFIQINCPYCGGNFRMGINKLKSFARCWSCGIRNLLSTLSDASGQSISECKKYMRGVEWRHSASSFEPKGTLKIPLGVKPIQKQHIKYLKKRGFDPDYVTSMWGVQGIGLSNQLQWRLWIPITRHGQIVSWTTRSLSDHVKNRYMTARPSEESYSHKKCIYGEEYCSHACIVHEGPLDVWATGPGAVCTFGLSYSRAQILALAKYLVRIVCLDNSEDAQRTARRMCDELMAFPGKTYNVTLDAKDAASAKEKELKKLRKLLRQ